MWRMIIPLASLTDEHYTLLGKLAVLYHAVLMADADHVTIEFRTIRLNGEDVSWLELAIAAAPLLLEMVTFASNYDPIPSDVAQVSTGN